MESTWALVRDRGLSAVTMSEIAEKAGIGRATLYKYFTDVGAILSAWHRRHVASHLDHLTEISEENGGARKRLQAVLEAYALIVRRRGHLGGELAALLHRGDDVAEAERRLLHLIQGLIAELAKAGKVRTDFRPEELASYCLHSLGAAAIVRSEAAARRLVRLTIAALKLSE